MEYFLLWALGAVAALAIQYYLIKNAVLSALKETNSLNPTETDETRLLEIIAMGVGSKPEMEAFLKNKRKHQYNEKLKKINFDWKSQNKRNEQILELQQEYADILNE